MATAAEHRAEIDRINANIAAAFTKAQAKGATLPTAQNSDNLADTIETIPSSADIPVKTSDDMTASGATVTAPAGWYKQAASKSVATATQATPSISVSSGGLITASATQSAGYVTAGTKSGTKQLTTQAAKTVTPTKSEQTVVAAGRYTTGAVKVAKIPDNYIETNDATAQDVDIVVDKIAYVDGKKVIGTNPYEKAATDTHIANALAEIANKGITVPSGAGVDDLADLIKTIPGEYVYQEIVQFTSSTQSEYTVQHNLGVIPTWVIVMAKLVSGATSFTAKEDNLVMALEFVWRGASYSVKGIYPDMTAPTTPLYVVGQRQSLSTTEDAAASSIRFYKATTTSVTIKFNGIPVYTPSENLEYVIFVGKHDGAKSQ